MADNQPFGKSAFYVADRVTSNQTINTLIKIIYNRTLAGTTTNSGYDTSTGIWTKPDDGIWIVIAGYEIGDLEPTTGILFRAKVGGNGVVGAGTTVAENRHTNARSVGNLRQLGQLSFTLASAAGTTVHFEADSFDETVAPQFRGLTTSRLQLIKISD